MDSKLFNDCVHGHMYLHPLLVVITDTPQVQRLRNIKQLGPCYFVYPTACHTRFEHSLGTSWIAGRLFDSLTRRGLPSDVSGAEELEKKKLCIQIAGLCHDLGHGPFSHTWEKFRGRVSGDRWKHEDESIRIFEELLDEGISPSKRFQGGRPNTVREAFAFYGLDDRDITLIKDLIKGDKNKTHYLYQIISNKNNGIDVDKWDYLARDSAMLNFPIGFDFNRLLNYCWVLKNENGQEEICFREKECSNLAEMFLARGRLHDRAYQHVKARIIEEMLLDAFVLANKRLRLVETPITQLTDHIYQKILYEDFGNDKDMKRAKEILKRIESRDLYKCIAKKAFQGKKPNLQTLVNKMKLMPDLQHYAEDITLSLIDVDMTKSNKGKPFKNVSVYYRADNQSIQCKKLDWDTYEDILKLNMESLKRSQVLVVYKGRLEFPRFLRNEVGKYLERILTDATN